MNKKHKLKKIAEDKLIEYLNENEEDIKYRTNTEQNHEQRRSNKKFRYYFYNLKFFRAIFDFLGLAAKQNFAGKCTSITS